MIPRKGLQFHHARQLAPGTAPKDRIPALCTVTAVRQGRVYFHNETGFKSYVRAERFAEIARPIT